MAVDLATLNHDPANARKHGAKNIDAIKASLHAFGQRKPIVVQRQGMIVRAGNGTLEAAKALGWSHLAAVIIDEDNATASQFAIADNRTADLAEWDDETLASLLDGMEPADREALAFDEDDMRELIDGLDPSQPEVVEDEAPEVPADPVTKTGDLIMLGDHRLLCGDSTNANDVARLMDGATADAIVTDPPYGVAYRSNWKNKFEGIEIKGDQTVETRDQSLSIFKGVPALVFGSWKQPKPKGVRAILIWDKGTVGMGAMDIPWFPSTEEIYVLGSGWVGSRVASVLPFHVRNEHHPTEKPVELLGHLIQRCPDGIIVDLFLGSGTTLIAAEQLGRKCYGMEISPAYCDVIVKRWENLTGKQAVRGK